MLVSSRLLMLEGTFEELLDLCKAIKVSMDSMGLVKYNLDVKFEFRGDKNLSIDSRMSSFQ